MRDCSTCIFHVQGRKLNECPAHCHDCLSFEIDGRPGLPYYIAKDMNPPPAPKETPIRPIRMELHEGFERRDCAPKPLDAWTFPAPPTLPAPSSLIPEKLEQDDVNHPKHYKTGGLETIDFLKAKLTAEEFRGFLKGNVLKYLSRAPYKGDSIKDIKKAQWYLERLVKEVG